MTDELFALVLVAPLATADMRAHSIPEVFLTDASNQSRASVRGELAVPLARELQRHCLGRGVWSKLLSAWKAWLRDRNELQLEEELPEGVPLVSHPLWLAHRNPSRGREHINVSELKSILELEKIPS